MANRDPIQTEAFKQKQFKPKNGEALGKVIGVRYPLAIDSLLQAMKNQKTDFIRQAVIEKLQREGILTSSGALPTPDKKRESKVSLSMMNTKIDR